MKEHPIIMSGDHPIKCLDGTKTMTRRVITKDNSEVGEGRVDWSKFDFEGKAIYRDSPIEWDLAWLEIDRRAPLPFVDGKPETGQYLHVPYNWEEDMTIYRVYPKWEVGDRLWVRETWWDYGFWYPVSESEQLIWYGLNSGDTIKPLYVASDETPINPEHIHAGDKYWRKRPSIHMPRWASRILLEITEIRAERLQEIPLDELIDEGIVIPDELMALPDHRGKYLAIQQLFIDLWDSLNAKRGYGWETTSWVWVSSFKLVSQ